MCGIFGWVPSRRQRQDNGLVEVSRLAGKLCAALAHRGPDDRGWAAFADNGILLGAEPPRAPASAEGCVSLLLGQTRLSIIDLSSAGHQPFHSPDGRYTLVYNGEIYNYLELRAELEQQGYAFKSRADSEVLLYALAHWGEACLTRLTGMFAFAFYDARENTLLCGRDFFGIKPFYYHLGEGVGFAFASELPALLEFPGISRALAPQQAYNYLCFSKYDAGSDTFLRDARQLAPGHFMRVRLDDPQVAREECYWRPDLSVRSNLSFAEAAEGLREIFLDSVRLHLRSDVPLGVALSGGIDSSAVACAVRHLEPEADLHTFSFIAKDSPVSEESWAAMAAGHIHAIRHTVEVEPAELVRDLDRMLLHLGEPFGSTSIYAQYRVFELAQSRGIKVTLDGQGADELLAGYSGYPGQRMATLLLRGELGRALRFAGAWSRWPGRSQKMLWRNTIREFTPSALVPLGCKVAGTTPTPPWLDIRALREEGVALNVLDERRAKYPCPDKVRQTLAYQLTWEGLPQLLRHGDRNAMAFSIESRVPFLTRAMAEFCLALPEEYLIDMQGRTKSVFREAMRGIVPDAILDRRDKIGFATPEHDWLRALSPWVESTLAGAEDIPYFNLAAARREWSAIGAGAKKFDWRVWRWLNYVRWVELFGIQE